jgi:hypothetical protein
MSKINNDQAEAISLLQAGNPEAFKVMIDYFCDQYSFEAKKCVDTPKEKVERHQGRASAFGEMMDLHLDAQLKINSGK